MWQPYLPHQLKYCQVNILSLISPLLPVLQHCIFMMFNCYCVPAPDDHELRVRRLMCSEMFYLEQLCSVFDVYADPLRYQSLFFQTSSVGCLLIPEFPYLVGQILSRKKSETRSATFFCPKPGHRPGCRAGWSNGVWAFVGSISSSFHELIQTTACKKSPYFVLSLHYCLFSLWFSA